MGLQGVPAFKIGEEIVVGLDIGKIQRLLDYTVTPCESCKKRMRVPKGKGKIKVTCPSCGHKFIKDT
jgi:glutaredoxin 3